MNQNITTAIIPSFIEENEINVIEKEIKEKYSEEITNFEQK